MANDERIKNLCNHIETQVRAMVITEQAPVADAQTLEDLARIGRAATQSEGAPKWENLGHITKQMYLTETAAILRAARPVLDVTAEELEGKWLELGYRKGTYSDNSDLLAWLNTRIRYRVEVPTAECPTCAEKDREIEALMADMRAHADAQSDLITALGRADAETKEAWEKYKRRDNQYLECHRQMQAAQTRVTELEYQINATCARVRAALEGEA